MQDVGAAAAASLTTAAGGRTISLSCRGLWKIFGHGAEELLRHQPPSRCRRRWPPPI